MISTQLILLTNKFVVLPGGASLLRSIVTIVLDSL